jgi:hypothetical protein
MNPWQFQQGASVVDEVSCRDEVGSIDHEIVPFEDLQCVVWIQPFKMGHDLYVRVQIQQALTRYFGLGSPHVLGSVDDLALKVRQVDHVVVDDGEAPNPGRCEVQKDRATKSTCPHHGHG